jgi:hypothetical protein
MPVVSSTLAADSSNDVLLDEYFSRDRADSECHFGCRWHYVKELVLRNFAGVTAEQLLERMIELSLYAEEKLKAS